MRSFTFAGGSGNSRGTDSGSPRISLRMWTARPALHSGRRRTSTSVNDEEHDAGGILDGFRREAVYRPLGAQEDSAPRFPEGDHLLAEPIPDRRGPRQQRGPVPRTDEVLADYRQNSTTSSWASSLPVSDPGRSKEVLAWRVDCLSLEVDAANGDNSNARRATKAMLANQERWDGTCGRSSRARAD